MLGSWILIIVLGMNDYRSGFASVQAEFTSYDKCMEARKHIVFSIFRESRINAVISQGCYKK